MVAHHTRFRSGKPELFRPVVSASLLSFVFGPVHRFGRSFSPAVLALFLRFKDSCREGNNFGWRGGNTPLSANARDE